MRKTLENIVNSFKKNLKIGVMLVVGLVGSVNAGFTEIYEDTLIESGYYRNIAVFDSPQKNTTLTMTGGEVGNQMHAYDNSTINFKGGHIRNILSGFNDSTINYSGGNIGNYLAAYNNSTINYSGGYIHAAFMGMDNSIINITGGKLRTGLTGEENSILNIYKGDVGWVWVSDQSIVNVRGGEISKHLYARDESRVFIYGYGFDFDLNGGCYGDGRLTGFWENGTPFSVDYYDSLGGWSHGRYTPPNITREHVFVNYTPEPATLGLLGLGSLFLINKRKKK